MLVVGLTGGIGSGKSTVAGFFSQLGVPVVDADAIAREVTAPGQPALAEIARSFGGEVLDEQGRLRRDRLRRIVFADAHRRGELEHILHPRIRNLMRRRLARIDAPYSVAVIPLLVETGQRDLVQRVLVVDSPPDLQYERIRRRDGMDDAEIGAIIHSQASREGRLAAADDVILNDGDLDTLKRRVIELHAVYSGTDGYASK